MSYTIKLKKCLNTDAKLFYKQQGILKIEFQTEIQLANALNNIVHNFRCPFLIMSLNVYENNKLIKTTVLEDRLRAYLGNSQTPYQY